MYTFQGVEVYLDSLFDDHMVLKCLFEQKELILDMSYDDMVVLESNMDEAQQYYISYLLKERYQELLSKAKEKMSLMEEMIRLDSEFCELLERLETDKAFNKRFREELKEIKQIQIPLEDEETEGLSKGGK